ncbi:MAG TPA: hypothetical protein PKU93_02820 [Candidatus Pacearchaeota archaeon]|mgnify:CR=1 FL=1|nr:hypothetical protein [Candidatus Pacearchaeota archaeon]
MNKKLLLNILALLFLGGFVFADGEGGLVPPIDIKSLSDLIDAIATWLFNIGIILAPLMFVVGGIMFATAFGNATKIQNAKNLMFYTAIGIFVIVLARSLVEVLQGFIK